MGSYANDRYRAMHQEYGHSGGGTCGNCCNYQKHPTIPSEFYCVAFGFAEKINCIWSGSAFACGLLNKPFLALRPQRKPLVELVAPRSREKDTADPAQFSLFSDK